MSKFFEIYEKLYNNYGQQHWWPAGSPYEVMIGAVLTQNTNWNNVEKAIGNFKGNVTPEFIDGLTDEELISLIRPSGFFNMKTKRLRALNRWFSGYGYNTEKAALEDTYKLRSELLSISGIGRETADSILLYALQKPVFVIDAYTRRIFTRLGFNLPEDYDDIRRMFEDSLEQDTSLYNEYHALIVRHAKTYCKTAPVCGCCSLYNICPQIGIDKAGKV